MLEDDEFWGQSHPFYRPEPMLVNFDNSMQVENVQVFKDWQPVQAPPDTLTEASETGLHGFSGTAFDGSRGLVGSLEIEKMENEQCPPRVSGSLNWDEPTWTSSILVASINDITDLASVENTTFVLKEVVLNSDEPICLLPLPTLTALPSISLSGTGFHNSIWDVNWFYHDNS